MDSDPDELVHRIEAFSRDRASGASELLAEALQILAAARKANSDMRGVAQAICLAQPTMAPVWNAAAAALADDPNRLPRFEQRVRRAPAALARFAATHFTDDDPHRPLHLVTLSRSGSVLVALAAIGAIRTLHVSCGESRPALEGQRLASQLASAGVPVTYYTDASLGHALADADAVIVGADAIAATWFINKSGTRMLASDAATRGIPVYVVAAREKFVSSAVARRLIIREGASGDVWPDPPAGIDVRNPYFEVVPLDLVSNVISDVGVLGGDMMRDLCDSLDDESVALRGLRG